MTYRPPLHPELAEYLAGAGKPLTVAVGPDDIPAAREAARRKSESELERARRRDDIRLDTWPVPDSPASLLVIRPTSPAGDRALVLSVHGGGMISGTSASGLRWLVEWALGLDATVVSLDYRLAPEHPYPAALDDCDRALDWLGAEPDRFGADPARMALAGTSAGGGIAAGVTLRRRDRRQSLPAGLMLLGPMLDDRTATQPSPSSGDSPVWGATSNATGWSAYLGRAGDGDEPSPYAAPGRASDLTGFPPTYLDVGTTELFRPEVVAFARQLWRDGNATELHVWAGGFHGFDQLAPWSRLARQAQQSRMAWLEARLRPPEPV